MSPRELTTTGSPQRRKPAPAVSSCMRQCCCQPKRYSRHWWKRAHLAGCPAMLCHAGTCHSGQQHSPAGTRVTGSWSLMIAQLSGTSWRFSAANARLPSCSAQRQRSGGGSISQMMGGDGLEVTSLLLLWCSLPSRITHPNIIA